MVPLVAVNLVVLLLLESSEAVIYKLNESEYNKMPALYALDPYEPCLAEPGGVYCVVDVDLLPGTNADLMKMIEEYSKQTMKHFNHSQIHRGVCLPKNCNSINSNDTEDLRWCLEDHLNFTIYTEYRLEGKVANIRYCNREGDKIQIDTSDIIMAIVYLVLIMINVIGSFYDILFCNKEDKSGNPYLLAFSMRRNWARLTASSGAGDEPRLERLKQFNGLRTMTMICVIFSHTTLIISFSYVNNPLYIETSYEDPLKQILFNGSLVTHTFFVMSSFLLAYNFQLHSEKHPVTWWNLPKGMILRWIRLTPTYALILFSITTWMRYAFHGPLWQLVVSSEAEACRQYWWAQLLYINNYVYEDAFCFPQTWYLAADTQLFFLGLLVCVGVHKCRARTVTLALLFVIAITIVGAHTYFQDLEAVVIQSPELYRNLYASDPTFRLLYIRGHTNISTYILGLAGGFIAYHLQNGKDLTKYKKHRWVIWLVFPAGLSVILSGGLFYSDGWRAPVLLRVMYAMLYKPLFQFLIVTLILGIVFKFESIYRGIIEWRGFTWMGRVSYSAFLLHTLFQRGLVGAQLQPIQMSDYLVLMLLAATVFITYMCAVGLWLMAEAPVAQLVRVVMRPATTR